MRVIDSKKSIQINAKQWKFILPPYPRKMGTYIPNKYKESAFELENISFTTNIEKHTQQLPYKLQYKLDVKNYIVGYDGYGGIVNQKKSQTL